MSCLEVISAVSISFLLIIGLVVVVWIHAAWKTTKEEKDKLADDIAKNGPFRGDDDLM